jgi:hypothetical protein
MMDPACEAGKTKGAPRRVVARGGDFCYRPRTLVPFAFAPTS